MNERKKGKLFRFAVDLFCSTLKQVTKRDFEYRCNKADIAAWDNFIEHLNVWIVYFLSIQSKQGQPNPK